MVPEGSIIECEVVSGQSIYNLVGQTMTEMSVPIMHMEGNPIK